jgi:hypothetical protein
VRERESRTDVFCARTRTRRERERGREGGREGGRERESERPREDVLPVGTW